MKNQGIEDWEQKLIDEADAIDRMRRHGRPMARGARTAGAKLSYKKTQPATVGVRDAAAMHVGFAPDRTHG